MFLFYRNFSGKMKNNETYEYVLTVSFLILFGRCSKTLVLGNVFGAAVAGPVD
jgi:hypothetical protein